MRKLAPSHVKNLRFVKQWLVDQFFQDQNQWILWIPVFLGCGIGIHHFWDHSLDWRGLGALLSGLLILSRYAYKRQSTFFLPSLIPVFITIGFTSAKLEHYLHEHPILSTPLKDISLRAQLDTIEDLGDQYRLILSNIETDPFHDLKKIRLTVAAKHLKRTLRPGEHISTVATLMPLPKPLSPGMYDFRASAYFQSLSAVGRAKSDIIGADSLPAETFSTKIQTLRDFLNTHLKQSIPGEAGKIAAALVTGERSGLNQKVRQDFSDAGIAHILAISGLHMAIVAGLIFFLVRGFLCFIPKIVLRFDTKKIAALLTALTASFYVLLCWPSISARRAYFMILFVMLAILLNRKPLSLRTLSFAAIFILIFTPHSLLSPSFQLSFAAVTALIAAYEHLNRPILDWQLQGGIWRKLSVYFLGIFGTTLLATLATASFTLYIFQSFSLHSLWTNLIAIPLASFVIMPLEVLSILTIPFSFNHHIATILGQSLEFLIYISHLSSQMSWGVLHLPKPSLLFMIMLTLGGLWMCLWRQSWRWGGILPSLIGIVGFICASPPDLFISNDARTFAIREGKILWINSHLTDSYAAQMWSKYAGHLSVQNIKESDLPQQNGRFSFISSDGIRWILIPPRYKGKIYCPTSNKVKLINLSRRHACSIPSPQELTAADIREKGGLLMGKIKLSME